MDIQGYHVRFDNLLINNADSYNADNSSSVTDRFRRIHLLLASSRNRLIAPR